MARKGSTLDREKINFMMSRPVVMQLKKLIPAGERSDFVNTAMEAALLRFQRQKAIEGMEAFRKKYKLRMTTAEIIRLKNYGRK